ncbi:hypothetical protein IJD34_06780 [bacterium]|nr:hypothetical protein [bacterium]
MVEKYIKTGFVVLFSSLVLTTSNICVEKVTAQPTAEVAQTATVLKNESSITPLMVVNNPKAYLNKTVEMTAKFDKFSTLGLDYKSAFKSSEDYISFLIKRDDTTYDIPLSEMKLFLKREMAEKFIDLKTNDEIFIKGVVFSDALGDPWIEVSEINVVKKAEQKD